MSDKWCHLLVIVFNVSILVIMTKERLNGFQTGVDDDTLHLVNFCLLLGCCSKQLRLELSANVLYHGDRFANFEVTIDDVR